MGCAAAPVSRALTGAQQFADLDPRTWKPQHVADWTKRQSSLDDPAVAASTVLVLQVHGCDLPALAQNLRMFSGIETELHAIANVDRLRLAREIDALLL